VSQQRFRYRHLIRGKLIEPIPDTSGTFPSSERDDREADVYELGGTQEGAGTIEEIAALVREGRLAPRDLVDLGHGWQSLQDCDELEEACAPALRREKLVLMAKFAGATLLAILIALARMRYLR
jgi:hypothetical protein